MIRNAISEAVGTAFLLATVVGSGIMGERLAGGNVAIALLANTLATGAGLVALIVAVGFSSYRKRVHGGQRRWWRREESGPEYFLGRLLGWGTVKTEQSATLKIANATAFPGTKEAIRFLNQAAFGPNYDLRNVTDLTKKTFDKWITEMQVPLDGTEIATLGN